jgi:hypothetical protein
MFLTPTGALLRGCTAAWTWNERGPNHLSMHRPEQQALTTSSSHSRVKGTIKYLRLQPLNFLGPWIGSLPRSLSQETFLTVLFWWTLRLMKKMIALIGQSSRHIGNKSLLEALVANRGAEVSAEAQLVDRERPSAASN